MIFYNDAQINYIAKLDNLIPLVGRVFKYVSDEDIEHIADILLREYDITSDVFKEGIKNKKIPDFKGHYFNDRRNTIITMVKYLAILINE